MPVYCAVSTVPRLYRRIDNDTVHLASLTTFLHTNDRENADSCVEDSTGCLSKDAHWISLLEARDNVNHHTRGKAHDLDLFLSEGLYQRFPYEIHELRPLPSAQCGPMSEDNAEQLVQTPRKKTMPVIVDVSINDASRPWERGMTTQVDMDELLIHGLDHSSTRQYMAWPDNADQPNVPEMPLSPQEEEAFQSLCQYADWDGDAVHGSKTRNRSADVEDVIQEDDEPRRVTRSMKGKDTAHEPPLRRSQRTAKKVASQRTAIMGTRHRSRAFSSS